MTTMKQVAKLRIVRAKLENVLDKMHELLDEEGVVIMPIALINNARRLLEMVDAHDRQLTDDNPALRINRQEGWDA